VNDGVRLLRAPTPAPINKEEIRAQPLHLEVNPTPVGAQPLGKIRMVGVISAENQLLQRYASAAGD